MYNIFFDIFWFSLTVKKCSCESGFHWLLVFVVVVVCFHNFQLHVQIARAYCCVQNVHIGLTNLHVRIVFEVSFI